MLPHWRRSQRHRAQGQGLALVSRLQSVNGRRRQTRPRPAPPGRQARRLALCARPLIIRLSIALWRARSIVQIAHLAWGGPPPFDFVHRTASGRGRGRGGGRRRATFEQVDGSRSICSSRIRFFFLGPASWLHKHARRSNDNHWCVCLSKCLCNFLKSLTNPCVTSIK